MYDLIIIGAGPAGLTASIYASCFHLKHLVIGKLLGGQMQYAPEILNYPGFENISGKELTERMVAQVKKLGGEIVVGSVIRISKLTGPAVQVSQTPLQNRPPAGGLKAGEATFGRPSFASPVNTQLNSFEIETQEGKKYQAKAIILATGTERRKLNVPGEAEYTGSGVYYNVCGKIDYVGKVCGVAGGANAALQAAVELSKEASKVYIIYRGDMLRGDPIWLEQVRENHKIEVIYNTEVIEIVGDDEKVKGVRLRSNIKDQISNIQIKNQKDPSLRSTSEESIRPPRRRDFAINQSTNIQFDNLTIEQFSNKVLPLDKLFIEIGGVPGTALVIPLGVEMDEGGYIKVNARMATNVAGIFAAGDLVGYGLSIEQISSAVGLGARAAASVFAYLKQEKTPTLWGEGQIRREVT